MITVALKDFNPGRLQEELQAAGLAALITHLRWAGFEQPSARRYTPMAARKVVDRPPDDFADPGELRVTTIRDLTSAERNSLDAVLAAHDFTVLSAEQTREDQDTADVDALLTTGRQTYLAHLRDWDTYTTQQKVAAAKDLFQLIGLMLRALLRRERGAEI